MLYRSGAERKLISQKERKSTQLPPRRSPHREAALTTMTTMGSDLQGIKWHMMTERSMSWSCWLLIVIAVICSCCASKNCIWRADPKKYRKACLVSWKLFPITQQMRIRSHIYRLHVRAFRNCVALFKILVCEGSQAYNTQRTHSPERKTDNEPKSIGFGWTATCAVLRKGSLACKMQNTRITACQ